jgi:hypothetical protein
MFMATMFMFDEHEHGCHERGCQTGAFGEQGGQGRADSERRAQTFPRSAEGRRGACPNPGISVSALPTVYGISPVAI